jgi:hypothetical protein
MSQRITDENAMVCSVLVGFVFCREAAVGRGTEDVRFWRLPQSEHSGGPGGI